MAKKDLDAVMEDLGIIKEDLETPFEDLVSLRNEIKESRPKTVNTVEYDGDKLTLIPIGDVHLGSINCNLELFKKFVDYIMADDSRVTIIMGDLAENATKTSVGLGLYEEDMHLREQMYELKRILKPLADKGKILGMHPGNHEFRSACLTGIDPIELLAHMLDVPYLGYQGFTSIKVKDQTYHIMSFHGAGGGGSSGSKVNMVERLTNINPACDLYLAGHTHFKSAHDAVTYTIDGNDLVPRRQIFVSTGSFLDYFGGYAEMKALKPSSVGAVIIDLYGDEKYINAMI